MVGHGKSHPAAADSLKQGAGEGSDMDAAVPVPPPHVVVTRILLEILVCAASLAAMMSIAFSVRAGVIAHPLHGCWLVVTAP